MTRVALTDDSGRWFETDSATSWDEATWWNGNNHISRASGSQWDHERLYYTRHGGFILNWWSQMQGREETYCQIEHDEAARWLIRNEHSSNLDALPEDVKNVILGVVAENEV